MDYAKELAGKEGMEKGLEQGRKERDIEIAKNILSMLDNEMIAQTTGLSIEEIESLR